MIVNLGSIISLLMPSSICRNCTNIKGTSTMQNVIARSSMQLEATSLMASTWTGASEGHAAHQMGATQRLCSLPRRRCMNRGGRRSGDGSEAAADRRWEEAGCRASTGQAADLQAPIRWLVQSSCRWPAVIPGGGHYRRPVESSCRFRRWSPYRRPAHRWAPVVLRRVRPSPRSVRHLVRPKEGKERRSRPNLVSTEMTNLHLITLVTLNLFFPHRMAE
jgi:hypothetical protein